jgi:hypothetical protein
MSDKKIPRIGTKAQVYHQSALMTPGGLKKSDLMKTKKGRIVSKKQHASGKRAIKHLFALGYKPKKGTFKAMRKSMVDGRKKKGTKKSSKKHTKKGKKHGGAAGMVGAVADISGNMVNVASKMAPAK